MAQQACRALLSTAFQRYNKIACTRQIIRKIIAQTAKITDKHSPQL